MTAHNWTLAHMPEQNGKIAIVTGGNSGIGYEAALGLVTKGAHVILAVRSEAKGQAALEQIRSRAPQAAAEVMALDLADLSSVRRFAQAFQERYSRLDLLINNAGVMALPQRKTADGFEMQFGTNHLGHFALTGLLLPVVLSTPAARIVTVSSAIHTAGNIDFDNLDGSRSYSRWGAYAQSKLANMLFAYELQRRLAASGSGVISVGCHPGYAATNLQTAGSKMEGSRFGEMINQFNNRVFAQSAAMGALPTLYAATMDGVAGSYVGPTGALGMRGYPGKVRSSARSYDVKLARRLWQVSEEQTGVSYALTAAQAAVADVAGQGA